MRGWREGSPGCHVSRVSLQPDEGGGKHSGIGDVAPCGLHGAWPRAQVTSAGDISLFFRMLYKASPGWRAPNVLQGTPTALGATEIRVFKGKNKHFVLCQDKPEQRLRSDLSQGVFSRSECLNLLKGGDINSSGAASSNLKIILSCPQINHCWAQKKAITQGLS